MFVVYVFGGLGVRKSFCLSIVFMKELEFRLLVEFINLFMEIHMKGSHCFNVSYIWIIVPMAYCELF